MDISSFKIRQYHPYGMKGEGSRRDLWWHMWRKLEREPLQTWSCTGCPSQRYSAERPHFQGSNKRAQLQTTTNFQSRDLSYKSAHMCKKKTITTPVAKALEDPWTALHWSWGLRGCLGSVTSMTLEMAVSNRTNCSHCWPVLKYKFFFFKRRDFEMVRF